MGLPGEDNGGLWVSGELPYRCVALRVEWGLSEPQSLSRDNGLTLWEGRDSL